MRKAISVIAGFLLFGAAAHRSSAATVTNESVWVEDSLPTGAISGSDGGDSWNWVNNNPRQFSGSLASQSSLGAGLHQHYFYSATQTLQVNAGDVLIGYAYLDPNNLPTEVMLQW